MDEPGFKNMRFWRSREETPAWTASRLMQASLLFGLAVLIGGIVALFHVRLSPPAIRPYVAVLLVVAACLQVALLWRSQQVRRRKRKYDDQSTGR
jgi:heme A synthase